MSASELAEITQAIKSMALDVDRIADKIVGHATKIKTESVKAADEVEKETKKRLGSIEREFKRLQDEQIIRISLLGKEWDKAFEHMEKKWREVGQEIERHMTQARGAFRSAGEMLGMSGGGGIFSAAKGVANGLLSQLPMGGVLGMVLFGKMKETEFAARGHAAARQFEAVGQVGVGVAKRFTGMVGQLWANMMDEGQIRAIAGSFAQFGVAGDAVLTKMGKKVKGFGDDVVGMSFAMDTLTNASAGTFAQAIGSAMQSSGQEIKKTTQDIAALGLEMRGTGVNVSQFILQLMQSTSALRFQAQGTDDLRKNVMALTAAYSGAGIKGPRLGAMVTGGMQALMGGVGQLSEGLSAVIGQRIGARTGKKVGGVDAIIAMQEGAAGQGGQFMGDVVKELGRMAKEITHGGTEAQQKFALQKVAPSLGIEGARAVVEINKAMEMDMAKGMTAQQAMDKHQNELNSAFKSKAQETSEFEKAMRRLTAQLLKVSEGLLMVLTNGLMNLLPALKSEFTILASFIPGSGVGGDERGKATLELNKIAESQQQGFDKIIAGFSGMGDVGLGLFNTMAAGAHDRRRAAFSDKVQGSLAAQKEREARAAQDAVLNQGREAAAGALGRAGAGGLSPGERSQIVGAGAAAYAEAIGRGEAPNQAATRATRAVSAELGDGRRVVVDFAPTVRVVSSGSAERPLVPGG